MYTGIYRVYVGSSQGRQLAKCVINGKYSCTTFWSWLVAIGQCARRKSVAIHVIPSHPTPLCQFHNNLFPDSDVPGFGDAHSALWEALRDRVALPIIHALEVMLCLPPGEENFTLE